MTVIAIDILSQAVEMLREDLVNSKSANRRIAGVPCRRSYRRDDQRQRGGGITHPARAADRAAGAVVATVVRGVTVRGTGKIRLAQGSGKNVIVWCRDAVIRSSQILPSKGRTTPTEPSSVTV